MVAVPGSVHPQVNAAGDRGRVEPSHMIRQAALMLKPSAAKQEALSHLLEQQRDPRSPEYHNWLTPEQFGERFGPGLREMQQVTAWLQAQGLTIGRTARGRGWVEFSGPAERIENAFHTELHYYEADGERHFANSGNVSVPQSFADLVSGVRGLNDYLPKRLHTAKRMRMEPEYTNGGGHMLAPDDLATIYDLGSLYRAGIDGTGQTLAIAGQTRINLTDVPAFRSYFHLPANDPRLVLYGPDPGIRSGDYLEAMLDLEWSGAVARNATILYVYSSNAFNSVMYAIDDNLAPVISASYAACEAMAPVFQEWAQQANAQGITWLNASGDGGAAGCGSDYPATVMLPANIPEVTAVGGTELQDQSGGPWWSSANSASGESALSYIPEKGWSGSGGGASRYYPKPVWQSGVGVPADGARDVPDISLSASTYDPYMVYSGGWWLVGGTSASSPSFAGIVALLNHYLTSSGYQSKAGVGNINPVLYQLAQTTPSAFHDIVNGNNVADTSSGDFGYQTQIGYDQVTGLGSVDAYNLVTHWTGQPSSMATTTAVAAMPTTIPSTGSVEITTIVSAPSGGTPPSGTVTLLSGSTQLASASLMPWGASALATFVISGSNLAVGQNTITATFAGANNFSNSSGSLPIMVTQQAAPATLSVVANPASISSTGSTQLMVTVQPVPGAAPPVGNVTFLEGNVVLGTAHLIPMGPWATVAFLLNGSQLQPGSNNITVSYQGAGEPSQGSVTISVAEGQ